MATTAPTAPMRASPRALILFALLLAPALLAGCSKPEAADPEVALAVADTRAGRWLRGDHWAYHAIYRENRSFDVTLVVHEANGTGFRLGSNSSSGFFGLPFTGNVSKDLNPRIGPEDWPLYSFPLHDGKTWKYQLFGYDVTSVARAAVLDVPGVGRVPGFTLEASAYGQVFARYDYSREAGWFTRLELVEPTDGSKVLDVSLVSFGENYNGAYFVERTLREVRVDYPGAPGAVEVQVPPGFTRVRAFLTAEATAGLLRAELKDPTGNVVASVEVTAKGVSSDSAAARGPVAWTLDHKGLGVGVVHLEITGVASTGRVPPPPANSTAVEFSLLDVLQSTRPARPQTGHATSTGWPVAV